MNRKVTLTGDMIVTVETNACGQYNFKGQTVSMIKKGQSD